VINQIRGFLLERSIIVRQGLHFLRHLRPDILAKWTDVLSPRMVRIVNDLVGDWRQFDERIETVTDEIETLAKSDDSCRRVMTVPGIGPLISSAMVRSAYSFEIFRIALDFDLQLNPQIPCRSLRFVHILRCLRTGLADQKRDFGKLGKQLSNHLQSFRYDIGADGGHSGDVAAGPGKACDKPCRHRVYTSHKHHRRLTRNVPRRQHRRRSRGYDDVHLAMHQLRCGVGDLRRTLRQAEVDDKVLAFDKAEFAQSLSKAINESRWWRVLHAGSRCARASAAPVLRQQSALPSKRNPTR
jgi:hypothetical protein